MFRQIGTMNSRWAGPLIIGIGVIAALGAWSVLRLAGVDMEVDQGGINPIEAPDVVVASLIGGFAAWLVHLLMVRVGLAAKWWPSVGSIALAISMIGPGYYGEGSDSALALMALHFATGIVLIYGFTQLSPHPYVAHRRAERAAHEGR